MQSEPYIVLPMTLPSLQIVYVTTPPRMTEADYENLMEQLRSVREALTAKESPPSTRIGANDCCGTSNATCLPR
jgi:hypothetical protein